MRQLLYIEWLKIKNYRTFWVLTILFILSILGINYSVFHVKEAQDVANPQIGIILGSRFAFPNVWHTVSYISSFLLFLPGLMIITSISNEFTFKTHRQNIIDGWSRSQFINIKIVMVLILAFFSMLIVFITCLIFGFQSSRPLDFTEIEYVFYFFVQALSYGMVALLLSVLIRRSGLAIGVFFLYSYIIENAVGAFLNYGVSSKWTKNGPGDYLPLNTTDNLIPFPFFRGMVKFGSQPTVTSLLILSCVYLALYYLFSVRKFIKDDL
ncbi:MAG: hypothetical protein NVSMB45_15280 [Ginsengibacter sp.]